MGGDVRVVDGSEHPGLATKPGHLVLVGGNAQGKDLERDRSSELGVAGQIDDTHPAPSELAFDGIRTDAFGKGPTLDSMIVRGMGSGRLRR